MVKKNIRTVWHKSFRGTTGRERFGVRRGADRRVKRRDGWQGCSTGAEVWFPWQCLSPGVPQASPPAVCQRLSLISFPYPTATSLCQWRRWGVYQKHWDPGGMRLYNWQIDALDELPARSAPSKAQVTQWRVKETQCFVLAPRQWIFGFDVF